MITDIDYNKLVRMLLPVRLRQSVLFAWLRALVKPIRMRLYLGVKDWERRSWYDLKYQTGQVAYLEFVLNDWFDPVNKGIFIGSGLHADDRVYLYLDVEAHDLPIYLDSEEHPVSLFTDGELSAGSVGNYDFSINVPGYLGFLETTIRAVADRYKRDGKSYAIIYF